MREIEIVLRSAIDEDSFEAVQLNDRISRITAYVPSTTYRRMFEIRGNWTSESFSLKVPEKFFESKFPLRLQAQFPGGSKLAVEAKVYEPTRVDLALVSRNFIEGKVQHKDFSNKSINAAEVGCELSCPGSKKTITGLDACIECANSKGAHIKLCC